MKNLVLAVTATLMAQAPPARVLGTVTAVNAAASELSVKTDRGDLYGVKLSERAVVIKLAPGETNLTKGIKIPLSDLIVGDRVLARGDLLAEQKALIANSLIVNRKEEIAKKHERDREEWLRRGVLGVVTAVDPAARKVTLESRRYHQVVVTIKPEAAIRRYAEDSVRFADAKPSAIDKIQVKDQLRALGEKNADNTAIEAEDVVFGTFQMIAGRVISVDTANNQLRLDDPQAKRKLLVKITPDTNLRQLPPFLAAMISGGGPGAGGGMNRPGNNGQGPAFGPGRGSGPGSGPGPGANPSAGGGFRGGPGGGDPAQMLERFPKIELGGLKPGEAVMVSSTVGANAGELTAITLVAGVEAILTAPRSGDRAANIPGWSLDIGLPQ
ncbi:MAG: hypothetical protein IT168_17995 [Bryobacterales bacterium]|nr:hypothetical protein [Bryobacterales bacterium]